MTVSGGMVELSRTNLMAFVKATMPSYDIGWVHREICGQLMSVFVKVKRKESPRLIITMPPRHGTCSGSSAHAPTAW